MSVAHFPNAVNGRTNAVPECGPPTAAEPAPHDCLGPKFCIRSEECIAARGRKRQEDARRLSKLTATQELAAILRDAEQLASNLRAFMATHGPNHRCRLCTYLRAEVEHAGGGYPVWWEDMIVLRSNLESSTSMILNSTPGAITFELIRDQYESED